MKKEQIAIYVFVALLVLVFVYQISDGIGDGIKSLFGGNKQDERKITPPEEVPLQGAETGILTQEQAENVRELAQRLFLNMDGVGLPWNRDMQPWKELLELNDIEFKAVYNDFNNLYASLGDGTLREWISNETFVSGNVITYIIPFGAGVQVVRGHLIKSDIIERMNNLNLH